MRILYFGDPHGGLALIDAGLVPVGIVHGRRGGRGWKRFVPQIRELPRWRLPDLQDPAVLDAFRDLEPDLIVAAFYPQRIPQPVLDIAPGINVHPSDLPRWRGPDPCTWTIRAGDTSTAVCVHELTAGFDEGDILQRWPVPVSARATSGQLAMYLETMGARCIAEIAKRLSAGETIPAKPQTGDITWAPMVDPDEWEIDWTRSAHEVDAFIRAAQPDPGAYTGIGDELLVMKAIVTDAGSFSSLPPGTPLFGRAGSILSPVTVLCAWTESVLGVGY